MLSLHDDKTIAFEGRDVATLLPGLAATCVERINAALETAVSRPSDAITYSRKEHEYAWEEAESETWSRALREASDAVLEACNDLDPHGTDEKVTRVMQAAQAAIRALDE